jgi:ferrochelatase
MSGRLGVLLMTYGSPAADLHDLPQYLAAVRGGREPSPELVTEFRRRYELIGGSPLIDITRAQASEVERYLREAGVDAKATVGMRFSAPTIADGLRRLTTTKVDTVAAVVMSPQYSELLMSGYRAALDAAVEDFGEGAPSVHLAPAWYRHPGFVASLADRVREGLELLPPDTPVLMTAHSLPRRVADAEPTYLDQLAETAELVASAAGLPEGGWRFCWQSAGHEPGEWMKPDLTDVLAELRVHGRRAVLVAPLQFLADHLEILYDVDIGARQQAQAAGMKFARTESLNTSPKFVGALADIVKAAAWPTESG